MDVVFMVVAAGVLLLSGLWFANYVLASLAVPEGSPTDKFLGWFHWYRRRSGAAQWYLVIATTRSPSRRDYWTRTRPLDHRPVMTEVWANGRLVAVHVR